jgi:MoaA/NifB/PqqE/SkfB family radical SAM enzyme
MAPAPATPPGPPPLRAVFKLTYRCNNRCTFCRVDPFRGEVGDVPAAVVGRKMLAARDLGVRMVLFSGGEPTLRDDLPALARIATSLGLAFGLITNGRRLAYAPYRDALLGLGLAYVHTSLHGALPATHDALVGCASHGQVLAALAGLAGRVELHVNTVVGASNATELPDVSDLLARFAPATHKVCLMEPRGSVLENEAGLLLDPVASGRLAVAARERAQALYGASGLSTVLEGYPLCQIGGNAAAVGNLRTHNILYMSEAFEDALYPTDHGERAFPAAPCDRCAARADCPGVYVGYVERHGNRGLAALP